MKFFCGGHGILIPVLAIGCVIGGILVGEKAGLTGPQGVGLSILLAGLVVLVYGKTIGRTRIDRHTGEQVKHTFVFLTGTFWSLPLIGLGAFATITMWNKDSSQSAANSSKSPAEIAFEEANQKLSEVSFGQSGEGAYFFGNTPTATALAKEISLATREVRDQAIRREKDADKKSEGELRTYCHEGGNGDFAVMMRVPDLMHYNNEAKEFIVQQLWEATTNSLGSAGQTGSGKIAVATRGTVFYDKIRVGTRENGVMETIDSSLKAESVLVPFFATGQQKRVSVGATIENALTLPTSVQEWTSNDGKTFNGALIRFLDGSGEKAEFRREDGTVFQVPLERFSVEDREKLSRYFEATKSQ